MKRNNDSDSGSSQFEQIDSMNIKDIPDPFKDSIAYRASMTARIGDINDIKTLKQKVKILKGAVLKEREIKSEMEKKMEQLSTSYLEAQKLIEKKEETIIYQEQQLQQFREKIVILGHESNKYLDLYHKAKNQLIQQNDNSVAKQSEESDSILSSFKQIIGIPSGSSSSSSGQNASAEIQRLQKENFMLKEEIEKQKIAFNNAEQKGKQEAQDIHKRSMVEINKKIETLNQQNQELKDKIVEITTQLQQKTADLQEKDQQLTQLRQETNSKNQTLEKMKNELEFINDKCKKMDQKISNYLTEIEQKTNKITTLEANYELLKADKDSLQQQVDSMDERIMLFTLKKISGLYQDQCQVICRKDLEGQHIIDFDSVKERFTLNVLDIRDVICEFEPEPILTLALNKNQSIVLKGGTDLKIIEKKIRNFVNNSPTKRSLTRQNNQNKQDKGLLDNMYSFFK